MPFTVAATDKSYDVEVIIFSHLNSGDGGEHWPTRISGDPEQPRYNQADYQSLSATEYQLNNIANSLRQSRGYRVLLHAAWRQPDGETVVFPVNVPDGGQRLSGDITLSRMRYLHLDVDLVLAATNANIQPTSTYLEPVDSSSPVYALHEKRRIKKSRTLHYFDHPRFGVIATVTPYQSPEQIQQEALQDEYNKAQQAAEPAEAEILPDDDQLTR